MTRPIQMILFEFNMFSPPMVLYFNCPIDHGGLPPTR
jgi:hypothetical protein